jgi:hypothetical protein
MFSLMCPVSLVRLVCVLSLLSLLSLHSLLSPVCLIQLAQDLWRKVNVGTFLMSGSLARPLVKSMARLFPLLWLTRKIL